MATKITRKGLKKAYRTRAILLSAIGFIASVVAVIETMTQRSSPIDIKLGLFIIIAVPLFLYLFMTLAAYLIALTLPEDDK